MISRRGLCGELHKYPRYYLLISNFYSPKIASELINCSAKNTPSSDYMMRIGIARILRITREVIKLVLPLAVRGLGRHAVGVIQSIGVGKLALGGSKCVIKDKIGRAHV